MFETVFLIRSTTEGFGATFLPLQQLPASKVKEIILPTTNNNEIVFFNFIPSPFYKNCFQDYTMLADESIKKESNLFTWLFFVLQTRRSDEKRRCTMLFLIMLCIGSMSINATVKIPTSYGELIDKITILEIKTKKIIDKKKLKNIKNELEHLNKVYKSDYVLNQKEVVKLKKKLKKVNTILWTIEDLIREQEHKKKFSKKFVFLARCVYRVNDKRAHLKRLINEICNSSIIEEKSYTQYI
jgi:hypothetical protein